jgi:glycosyltransferase involved in cell wall biosynthesis
MSFSVSTIVCTHNHERWIERCIRSLLNQESVSELDHEIIVVDDASTDSTEKILVKFKQYSNVKIITNQKNKGLSASINIGMMESTGRYLVRVDSDDYVQRYFIFLMKFYLDFNRYYQAVCVDYLQVSETEEVLSRENAMIKEIACGIMFRRECLFELGLYNEDYKMREGHELRRRFLKSFKLGHLELPLYKYREHNSNRTKNHSEVEQYDNKINDEFGG